MRRFNSLLGGTASLFGSAYFPALRTGNFRQASVRKGKNRGNPVPDREISLPQGISPRLGARYGRRLPARPEPDIGIHELRQDPA